jgi:hypothetical protein
VASARRGGGGLTCEVCLTRKISTPVLGIRWVVKPSRVSFHPRFVWPSSGWNIGARGPREPLRCMMSLQASHIQPLLVTNFKWPPIQAIHGRSPPARLTFRLSRIDLPNDRQLPIAACYTNGKPHNIINQTSQRLSYFKPPYVPKTLTTDSFDQGTKGLRSPPVDKPD